MANRVFTALANQTIDSFVSAFVALSEEVFYDQKTGKLRHPGEFGAFRERVCADFLRPFIPSYLRVGSGFLINSNDEVSTQCDLVVYDSQYTPLITDAQNSRFFRSRQLYVLAKSSPNSRSELSSMLLSNLPQASHFAGYATSLWLGARTEFHLKSTAITLT